ncbi:hypothetical protein RJD38_18915 [Vibrio scophthalmi]|uniref:Uncharacterized protein n=1 Tax=Vibrio scophthalmi TaxID=45658 RepID=A0A1C7FE63_9VIBR|nr:hypothetical protein [Vibrio scophthalmi]ANU38280.1 hypothetical protein VSVS05_03242 [Vibrio scophthalmi]
MKKELINIDNHYDEFILEAMANFGSNVFSPSELYDACGPFLEKQFQSNSKKYTSKITSGRKSPAENFVHRFVSSAVTAGYLFKEESGYRFDVQAVAQKRFFYTVAIKKHVDYLKESTLLVGDRSQVSSKLNRIISDLQDCEAAFRERLNS